MAHYGFTPSGLTRDDQGWLPVMGEIHYSRLPHPEWDRCLATMKAGGVDIASSYVIWIHHEQIEGRPDFSGDRDLRAFVEAVDRAGLLCWLRIGPWVHAEVRNGGLPDWLLKQDFEPRTNDESYFCQVERFYGLIAQQVDGLLHHQGGPIIGLQIENEYGHCGGLPGEDGQRHMRRLTAIARGVGLVAPLVSATGWGGAVTGDLLPVMGGYADAPWAPGVGATEPSANFVLTLERDDHNIGSDLGVGATMTFDPAAYPYLTAELGGGLQPTSHRRPRATPADVGAMSLVKLGSGASLLGYYMYHGGLNPDGELTTLQESRATGYPNDLPVKSYDFQAPLGAYGQINDSWQEIRLLASFVHHFGADLLGMTTEFPASNPLDPNDRTRLRHSVRHNGDWGFVFVNNHVHGQVRPRFEGVRLRALGHTLPPIDVTPGEYGIYPVNMPVCGGRVRFAQATPLGRVGTTTVFYGVSLDATPGADVRLLTPQQARQAYIEDDCLVFSDQPLIGSTLRVEQLTDDLDVVVEQCGEGHYTIRLQGYDAAATDYGLRIVYRGWSAQFRVDGRLVDDDFYIDGHHWLGLGRLGYPRAIDVQVTPLSRHDSVWLDDWPPMVGETLSRLESVTPVRIDDRDSRLAGSILSSHHLGQ